MGKSLIIKGADFSQNGIVPDYIKLDWIGASNASGKHIASDLYFGNKVGNLNEELEFCVSLYSSKLNEPETGTCYSMGSGVNTYTNIRVWFMRTATAFYFGGRPNGSGGITSVMKQISGVSLWDNQPHVIKINRNGGSYDGNAFTFDAEPTLEGVDSGSWNNVPIYLDCYSTQGSGNNAIASETEDAERIHWVKFRRDDSLILDEIPVMRTEDEKVGFYDKITCTYKFRNDDSTPAYGA